jgi:hypothetical protein
MIAQVGMAMGRYYLKVNGVIVAVEASPCLDPQFHDLNWNEANLREAAEKINVVGLNKVHYTFNEALDPTHVISLVFLNNIALGQLSIVKREWEGFRRLQELLGATFAPGFN